ncbi:MAG TPA: MFS transporter [Anaerolineales bacterium]|nr:MFS transporter [Anaerolineales bacterium]
MADKGYRLYGYRWVVLAVIMLVNLTLQILWISYAPIVTAAGQFYGVSDTQIAALAVTSWLIAYLVLSIPASWAIDTYGIYLTVGLGAILMAVFGVLRGFAVNYTQVFWMTAGIAIAQPFLLNSWTKFAAHWFGMNDRATIVGLVTLSNLVGIAIGEAVPPVLLQGGMAIQTQQLIFGVVAAVSTLLFLLLARDKPPTPPCPPGQDARSVMFDGLKHALTVKDFWLLIFIAFVVLAIFNGVSSLVEDIILPRGFTSTDAGTLGALIVVGSILGSVGLSYLSDKQRKRRRFIFLGILLAIPGMLGITYATSSWLLMLSGFWLGFFLVGIAPVGFQYGAEIVHPTPEGTSNGLIQLFGQTSIGFFYLMVAMKSSNGSFTASLLLAIGLLMISLLVITQMKDPVWVKE